MMRSMNTPSLYKAISKYLLVLTAIVPLVVTRFSVYPFVFGKGLLYTGLVQLALLFAALYFFFDEHKKPGTSLRQNKYHWAVLVFFFVSLVMSTFFSASPYTSFWGTTEKGDGLFYYMHFLTFVALSNVLFEKIDWQRLSKSFMACALLISLLAWGERFTFSGIDFQPVSSLGNPAYLAAYLILSLAFVAMTAPKEETEKYKESYVVLYLFVGLTLVMLQVRGAIMGLGLAVFGYALYSLFVSRHVYAKKIAAAFCVLFVVGSGVFIATRSDSMWLKVPVLKKFAAISTQSGSVAERISAWKAGIEGFSKRPVLGWGNEQFATVYNAYGVTDVERFKESWFTGAHNKIVDVLVSGGIVGLGAYLALLITVLISLRKKPLAFALFIAYIVQNMFIFDTISSSMVLFAIVGFLFFESKGEPRHDSLCASSLCKMVSVICVVVVLVSLTYTVVIPFQQQRAFSGFLRVSSGEKLESLYVKATTPYNYHQQPTRIALVNLLRDYDAVKDPQGRLFFTHAVSALEQVYAQDPRDMESAVTLLESYIDLGSFDPTYYAKATALAQAALVYAPNTIKISHLASVALVGEKKYDEALRVLGDLLVRYPRSARTRVYQAVAQSFVEPARSRETTEQVLSALDDQYATFEKRDYITLLTLLARQQNIEGVLRTTDRALSRSVHDKHLYLFAFAAQLQTKNRDGFSGLLDRLQSAPYAGSLPIQKWRELLQSNNWDELSKDAFFADTFGEFTSI